MRPEQGVRPVHTSAVCALALLLAAGAVEVRAQSTGAVRGQLVHDDALVGAEVTVRGAGLADSTDADGEFLITDVPDGRQVLEARHPWLFRLGLSPLEQSVTVRPSDTVHVDFAIPGTESLIARLCPDSVARGGRARGAFVGQLVRRDNGEPLRGVRMRVAWSDSPPEARGDASSRLVRTDRVGRFTVCGVPGGSVFQALVGSGRYGQWTGTLTMPERGFLNGRVAYTGPQDSPGTAGGSGEDFVARPESPEYVLPPLTVPISPGTGLDGFPRRRENREGHFFTREEILATSPARLTDVFEDRQFEKVRVRYDYPGGHSGPYDLRLFDPDGPGTWCTPGLVVDGRAIPHEWVREGKWSLNRYDPDEIEAMEVYWKFGEVPTSFRGAISPDLQNLWSGTSVTSDGRRQPIDERRPIAEMQDWVQRCGTVVLWTERSGRLAQNQ